MINTVIFIFFALLDLSMVGLCSYCYSGKEKYSEGMILGVHVPSNAEEDEAVSSLTQKYRNGFRRSKRLNLAAGFLIPAVCFFSMGIFIPLWTLWCLEFCAFYLFYTMSYHRKMYALKLERQWFQGVPQHSAAVDTRVSAMSDRFPVSWKWHLPSLAAGLGLWIFPTLRNTLTASSPGIIFASVFASVCTFLPIVFLLLHLCLSGQKNHVYSQDSAVNEKLNLIRKRTWTGALVAADYASLVAGLYICARLLFGRELYFWDYIIYSTIDFLGAAARHLFVEDRMCSTSYAINMAHPAAKWWIGTAAVFCAAAVAGVLILSVLLMDLDFSSTELAIHGKEVTVSYSFYDCTFSLDDIQSAELLNDLPDDNFSRENGGDTENLLIGHFEGDATGKVMMFLYKKETPLIRIDLPEQTVFLNSDIEGQTEEWYQVLTE